MVTTLKQHGGIQTLEIEEPLLDALGIDAETPLEVTVSGNSLVVTPVQVGIGRQRVEETIDRLRPEYGDMLKRLAE